MGRPEIVTPYYDDGQVTIYHGDCREMDLAALGADVVVTDPPYGIAYSPGGGGGGFGNAAVGEKVGPRIPKNWVGDDLVRGDDVPFDPAHLLALGLPTVLWGGNHYADRLPASPTWFVWDKRRGLATNDFADCELAWTNLGGPARLYHHMWNGLFRDSHDDRLHPTQKPLAVMRWVLVRCPPGMVLDPYIGSGTTLMAAKEEGRRAVGIEIEERYCEVAALRLSQGVLGLPTRPTPPETGEGGQIPLLTTGVDF